MQNLCRNAEDLRLKCARCAGGAREADVTRSGFTLSYRVLSFPDTAGIEIPPEYVEVG